MVTATRGQVWGMTIAGSVLVAIGYRLTGLSIALSTGVPYLLMIALLVAVAVGRRWLREPRQQRLADLIETLGLFCWVSALGGLGSYAVAAASTGFQDALLARADAAIGFDWVRAYRIVAAHGWLSALGGVAYRSIFATPLVVMVVLVADGRVARAWTFIAIFGVALAATLVSFHFWPARSALAFHLGMAPGYVPATGLDHVAVIDALRSGALTVVDPARIVGMITFPSFHAVSAVLFSWAGWPVRRIRTPLLAVNAAMLAVTPIEGTHYIVDVAAGMLLAATLITALHWRALSDSALPKRRRQRTLAAA